MLALKYSRLWHSDHQRLPRPHRFLLASLLALATLLGVAAYQTPQAHASGRGNNNPIIHWDQSMIYQGQNNNNPEGPVGETAVVHGSGFSANQALALVIVAGDSNSDATNCQPPNSGSSVQVGTVNTDSSGNFNATFAWPSGVGSSDKPHKNSICAYSTDSNPTLVSSRDDGPFTVLTENKPTFSLSTTSVAAGNSLTITGQYWVPAQPLNITIASCADCDPGNNNVVNATASSVGLSTGTFSVNVPIPATIAANNYVVNVTSQAGPLDAYHISGLGVKQLAISAATVTPTPTAAPSPSATVATTPTTVATAISATATGSSNSGGGSNSTAMILLIVLAVLLLAVGGGIILFMLAQRKKQAENANGPVGGSQTQPGSFGSGQANPFNAQRTPVTPFPQGQPISTPGQFGNAANNSPFPGQNQSWQPNPQSNWQGNPQNNANFNNFQQQGNVAPGVGMGRSALNRQCVRCGNPLAPNSPVCGVCGTRNPSAPDPNDPTVAY